MEITANFSSPAISPPNCHCPTCKPPIQHPPSNPISYIYLGKFHKFASMGAGWLKPSNMNSAELILERNTTFNPPSPPGPPARSGRYARWDAATITRLEGATWRIWPFV